MDHLPTKNILKEEINSSAVGEILDQYEPSDRMRTTDDEFSEDNALSNMNKMIEDTIEALEKTLNIKALSDNEWCEIHEPDPELHEDIHALDFSSDTF